tara:strand:- start:167 stop:565 length:399 start_codon:yes stop_codon:yes gene_type:complete
MTDYKKPTIAKLSKAQKQKAMIEAMHQTLGNITASTRMIGISRSIHYKWMQNSKKYKSAIEECIEIDLDFSEAALRKRIQAGDTTAIIFHLKTKGKHRGYLETQHNLNTEIPKDDMKGKSVEELLAIINGED